MADVLGEGEDSEYFEMSETEFFSEEEFHISIYAVAGGTGY